MNTPSHQRLALEAARQGVVLLKNTHNTLPLDPKTISRLALVGPLANATKVMLVSPLLHLPPPLVGNGGSTDIYELGMVTDCRVTTTVFLPRLSHLMRVSKGASLLSQPLCPSLALLPAWWSLPCPPPLPIRYITNTVLAEGCKVKDEDITGFADAIQAASESDVTVLVMGLDQTIESEFQDRPSIDVPQVQRKLVEAVVEGQR